MKRFKVGRGELWETTGPTAQGFPNGFPLRPKRRAFELVLLCALSSTAWLASASMFSEREVGPLC